VNNSKTHALLQTKLTELGHPNTQVRFIKAEQAIPRAKPPEAAPTVPRPPVPNATPPPPSAPERERATTATAGDFKNDPLIQKALEMFKGQIVDVRT